VTTLLDTVLGRNMGSSVPAYILRRHIGMPLQSVREVVLDFEGSFDVKDIKKGFDMLFRPWGLNPAFEHDARAVGHNLKHSSLFDVRKPQVTWP
jgi:hypothetical protein